MCNEATSWSMSRLGNHAVIKARIGWKGLKAEEYVDRGFGFLATPNIKSYEIDYGAINFITQRRYDESPEIQLKNDDVLLVKDGSTLGISNIVRNLPFPCTINGSIALVRIGDGLVPKFFHQLTKGRSFQKLIEDKKSGLGVPHLFQADLRQFLIPTPSLPEQKSIANILDILDTAIQRTEAIIEKLKQVKQGLLHDLLTRGIDANGELRPTPTEAPDRYKDSPVGLIPKEWDSITISHACLEVIDCPHSTPTYQDSGVLVARTMHIKEGKFFTDLASRIPEQEYKGRIARLEPKYGDIILTREAPVGEAFVVPQGMRICLGQRVMLLRPNPDRLNSEFLLAQIYSGAVKDRVFLLTSGTTNPHLNVSEVKSFILPMPKIDEQILIAEKIQQINKQTNVESILLGKINSFKSGLMDDLLTGRVRVTDLLATPPG